MLTLRPAAAIACGLLFTGLSGCATPSYVAPTSGPLAQITVANESGRPIGLALYRNAAECRNREVIRPSVEPGARRTVDVTTQGLATLSMFQDTGVRVLSASPTGAAVAITGCSPTITFQAEPGDAYQVRFQSSGGTCIYDVTRTRRAGVALAVPEHLDHRVRKYAAAFDDSGSFCRD